MPREITLPDAKISRSGFSPIIPPAKEPTPTNFMPDCGTKRSNSSAQNSIKSLALTRIGSRVSRSISRR